MLPEFLKIEGTVYVMYFLLRNITSVPCKIDGSDALFQYVFPVSSLLQLLAITAGIKLE